MANDLFEFFQQKNYRAIKFMEQCPDATKAIQAIFTRLGNYCHIHGISPSQVRIEDVVWTPGGKITMSIRKHGEAFAPTVPERRPQEIGQ